MSTSWTGGARTRPVRLTPRGRLVARVAEGAVYVVALLFGALSAQRGWYWT